MVMPHVGKILKDSSESNDLCLVSSNNRLVNVRKLTRYVKNRPESFRLVPACDLITYRFLCMDHSDLPFDQVHFDLTDAKMNSKSRLI